MWRADACVAKLTAKQDLFLLDGREDVAVWKRELLQRRARRVNKHARVKADRRNALDARIRQQQQRRRKQNKRNAQSENDDDDDDGDDDDGD